MLFSSIPFLYYFLPLVLAVYFLTPRARKKRSAVSFRASCSMPGANRSFCVFMLLSIAQGYVFGRLIERTSHSTRGGQSCF